MSSVDILASLEIDKLFADEHYWHMSNILKTLFLTRFWWKLSYDLFSEPTFVLGQIINCFSLYSLYPKVSFIVILSLLAGMAAHAYQLQVVKKQWMNYHCLSYFVRVNFL